MSTYSINAAVITRTLDQHLRQRDIPEIRARLETQAKTAAPIISDILVSELEGHWVTKELTGWNFGRGKSGLPAGNIVSFFGLSPSNISDALGQFRTLMKTVRRVIVRKIPGTKTYNIKVEFPEVKEYYKGAPAPQPNGYSGSWLERLENGRLTNFDHFLSGLGFSKSRSGGGIQSKYAIKRSASTVPSIQYISEIYKNAFSSSRSWGKRLLSSLISKAR